MRLYYGWDWNTFARKMKDAVQAFKKAVSVRPDMAKAHYGLALAYQDQVNRIFAQGV